MLHVRYSMPKFSTKTQHCTLHNTQTFFFGKCYILFLPVPHIFCFNNNGAATRDIAINNNVYKPPPALLETGSKFIPSLSVCQKQETFPG